MMSTAKKTARTAKAKPTARMTRKAKAKPAPAEKLRQMAAAERVLAEAGESMNCKAMVEKLRAMGLYTV